MAQKAMQIELSNTLAIGGETKGMRCPKCGEQALVVVSVEGSILTDPRASKACRVERLDFDGASQCECTGCGETAAARLFKPNSSGRYTVVLLYPDYASEDYGADTYVDSVIAEDPFHAASAVQLGASIANNGDIPPDDFRPVAVFAGDVHMELDATCF